MVNKKLLGSILLLVSFICYAFLGYSVKRHETLQLLVPYFIAFGIYLYVVIHNKTSNLTLWLFSAILFRVLLFFSVPNLSDDFYRFIWDGRLLASGHHPFAEAPVYYLQNNQAIPGVDGPLFSKLNSPEYYTVYPPLSQYMFWIVAKLSPQSVYGSMIVLKIFVLIAEIASIFLIKKLLIRFNLDPSRVLIYALNPLIIVELVGNIHLEGIMIFFLLLAITLLYAQRTILSALFFPVQFV